jgi:cytochrome oxidase Cu insertion factor (SCO1/SenC/PrrC family)
MLKPRRAFLVLAAASLATLMVGSLASAQTAKFFKKYKGQLIVSDKAFEVVEDDESMGAQIKKNARTELTATGGTEDGASWDFHWIAVLNKKPGTSNATVFFYDVTGKERKQATYKDIGCDPSQVVIVSDMSISEDDGLKKGNKYEIVLATTDGGKQTVLAKGKVTFK